MSRLYNCCVLFSHILNTITKGSMHEPFSARCFRVNSRPEKFVNLLFFLDPQHCRKAYLMNKKELRDYLRNLEK